jgi:hypothetical protein
MIRGAGIVDESVPVNKQDIEAVLSYLPSFEKEGYDFGEMVEEKGVIPWADYSGEVMEFYKDLYTHKFIVNFDWTSWQDIAFAYYENPELIKNADLKTIRRLFTVHIRKDRFCEGHLLSVLESGHITKILQRLAVIYQSMTEETPPQ